MASAGVSVVVIGAGDRGSTYASFSEVHPDRMRVVAVAEPRPAYRERMADRYGIDPSLVFEDWTEVFDRPRLADAVVIATPDREHAGPAIAAAESGYHILLEKPMARTESDCIAIAGAVKKAGVLFSVCHPLRYTPHTQALREAVDSGMIGEIAGIQHLEPVGYWHQAHSFVRGNWRNEESSAFMLLTKSCHDLDWLRYMVGRPCVRVASFGSLFHFRPEQRPEGASDRCLDCPVEPECPYSAKQIYLEPARTGKRDWPVSMLAPDPTPKNVEEALRTGPYGRCVYGCDNDVVDHQVVSLEFESGITAGFTMTAFTKAEPRKSHIFGTLGHLYGDGSEIRHFDFLSDRTRLIPVHDEPPPALTGHGGGDYRLVDRFLRAAEEMDQAWILSGPAETLESHRMVFAAERSRIEGRVIEL